MKIDFQLYSLVNFNAVSLDLSCSMIIKYYVSTNYIILLFPRKVFLLMAYVLREYTIGFSYKVSK